MKTKELWEALWGLLFPRRCPSCGEIITQKNRHEDNPFICEYCYERLVFADPGKEPVGSMGVHGSHHKKKAYCDKRYHLMEHDENAKKMLYDLKYYNKKDNADFFGLETARRLGEQSFLEDADMLVPVPLHKRREFERGYNQAELLADKISYYIRETYGVDIPTENGILIRSGKTAPQKDLSPAERYKNVKGKFALSTKKYEDNILEILEGKKIVIVEMKGRFLIPLKEAVFKGL